MRRLALPSWAMAAIGLIGIIAVWWLLAVTVFRPRNGTYTAVPTPWTVLRTIGDSGFDFYWTNFSVTLREAAEGYLWAMDWRCCSPRWSW